MIQRMAVLIIAFVLVFAVIVQAKALLFITSLKLTTDELVALERLELNRGMWLTLYEEDKGLKCWVVKEDKYVVRIENCNRVFN